MHGLTDGDIWRLDIFEGSEYERRKAKVRVLEQGGAKENGEGGMGDVSQPETANVEGEEVEAGFEVGLDFGVDGLEETVVCTEFSFQRCAPGHVDCVSGTCSLLVISLGAIRCKREVSGNSPFSLLASSAKAYASAS